MWFHRLSWYMYTNVVSSFGGAPRNKLKRYFLFWNLGLNTSMFEDKSKSSTCRDGAPKNLTPHLCTNF